MRLSLQGGDVYTAVTCYFLASAADSSVVEHLPSLCEAVGRSPITTGPQNCGTKLP